MLFQEVSVIAADTSYRCGPLTYTKKGLLGLFAWLLCGDFCFSLMETIWPNILPLLLKSEGATDMIVSLVIVTIPGAMNLVMNPVIGTMSDRHRGRLGRRIPFLLMATPFIALFLLLLGFSREAGHFLFRMLSGSFAGISAPGVTIGVICVLLIGFRFFELFVNTVYWYLFNDVVPPAFLGRFVGLFRVVSLLAAAIFSFFLFQYAESHASLIFILVAILYGSVFLLMCLNVREGPYPAPAPLQPGRLTVPARIATFFKECFGHRIFRLLYVYTAIFSIGNAINTFVMFMALSIGLSLGDIGRIAGISGVAGMLLMYPMSSLVDRFHPIRIMLVAQACFCVVVAFKLIFLFHNFHKETAFWVYAAACALAVPASIANSAASLPMVMRIFPREKFGQFCAAYSMCGALGTIAGGLLAGIFLDLMKSASASPDYYYRFVPVWNVFFMVLAVWAIFQVYREWKNLGGDESYRPPVDDKLFELHQPARLAIIGSSDVAERTAV